MVRQSACSRPLADIPYDSGPARPRRGRPHDLLRRGLVRRLGEPAPGPVPLLLPPSPVRLLETPTYVFHRLGVERRRAETIHRCAVVAHRLEGAVELGTDELDCRLRSIAGVGEWT